MSAVIPSINRTGIALAKGPNGTYVVLSVGTTRVAISKGLSLPPAEYHLFMDWRQSCRLAWQLVGAAFKQFWTRQTRELK